VIVANQLWKVPATAIGGAAIGGFLFLPIAEAARALKEGDMLALLEAPLFILASLVLGLPIIANVLPYTFLGTLIGFWPSCVFFGRKRKSDLFLISIIGSILGAALVYLDRSLSFPNIVEPIGNYSPWVGAMFGVLTGYIGWVLMEPQRIGRFDG
jgi:hypothetical protein